MANIRKRTTAKNGLESYQIRISLGKDPYSGKYLYHSETFLGDKRAAVIRAKELEVQISKNELIKDSGMSVKELTEKFLDMKKSVLKSATFRQYQTTFNIHFLKAFGNHQIKDLKPELFDKFFNDKLDKGLSGTTVHHLYKNIKTTLAFAVDREFLSKNPLDKVPIPKRTRPELNIPTPEQVNDFLQLLLVKSDWVYNVTSIAVATGMRRGEIMGLKWSDLDFEKKIISIERTAVEVGSKVEINSPKTKDSIRKLYIGDSLIKLLKNWKKEQSEKCNFALNRKLSEKDFLFHNIFAENKDVPIYHPTSVTQCWNRCQKELNLQGIRFHDLRHFHAIQLLIQGKANIKDIQNRLGHSDSAITMDTYMRYVPEERNKEVGASADELLKFEPKVIEGKVIDINMLPL